MTLLICSLGQKIKSNIEILKNNFQRLSQSNRTTQQIWEFFIPHLTQLRLEKLDPHQMPQGLENVRQAFNQEFRVDVDYDTFLKN
ncbi:MAG TPA: hypothetical protein VHD33_01400, partial [Legionellaceae bacterium]|nr:hypothetical protein [Legionellaceae bacterium]